MLYLMTSPMTHTPTVAYWKKMGYFGLAEDQVFIFQQVYIFNICIFD